MKQLTVPLVQHVPLHIIHSSEPLALLITPQAHTTLPNLEHKEFNVYIKFLYYLNYDLFRL